MIIIYLLEKNQIPFYVGKCNNINVRYSQHKKTYGGNINIKVLELVEDKDWKFKERYYIALFKSQGFNLENKNKGGGGPTKLSESSKQKITNSKLGNNYKLKNISKGEIEEMYKVKNIQEIADELNLTFPTVKNYLVENNLYVYHKNRKPVSKETKTKKSKLMKGKNIISVEQYDLKNNKINEFNSITEACLSLNKPGRAGDITSACQGKQKTAFGYIWKYKEI
jgi:hypothetical protein